MFESGLKNKRLNINPFWSEIGQEFPEKFYAAPPKISGSTSGDGQYEIPAWNDAFLDDAFLVCIKYIVYSMQSW